MKASGLLFTKDVCERFKLTRAQLYYRIRKGKFPAPDRFGRFLCWSDALIWMLENQLSQPAQPPVAA